MCPEKCNVAEEGSGAQNWWEVAEGAGDVSPGEKRAQGVFYCSLQLPGRRVWPGGGQPLLAGNK